MPQPQRNKDEDDPHHGKVSRIEKSNLLFQIQAVNWVSIYCKEFLLALLTSHIDIVVLLEASTHRKFGSKLLISSDQFTRIDVIELIQELNESNFTSC